MKPVTPADIRSNRDYELSRDEVRRRILTVKARRRIHVGTEATLLFENRQTLIYQIQEILRIEHIEEPRAIRHEIDTYNELLPAGGELSGTLLLEYEDADVRARRLAELVGIERHLSVAIEGAGTFAAVFDLRQMDDERVSAVHYVKFPIGQAAAAAVRAGAAVEFRIDHPALHASVVLSPEQHAALVEDLSA